MLWRGWNPIGREVPYGEYDVCVPPIIRMLESGAGVEELAAFLGSSRGRIVGNENPVADQRVAHMLYEHLYL
jgi:hypothetical protein